MLIDDWLPAGYATLLAGHGGAGKSSIALRLAVCMALGRPFFGMPVAKRNVLYLSCEDRRDVLHWRLSRICNHIGIDMAALQEHGSLDLIDLVGVDSVLWESTSQGAGPVGAYYHLVRAMDGVEVLLVDGVADVFAGNENARGDVKRFINKLVGLIPPKTGAVVLIHHVNKLSAGAGASEGYSGSTAWHNSVRARWYLRPEVESTEEGQERTGRLLLDLQKSNLGVADQQMVFQWDDGARLFVGQAMQTASAVERRARDQDELDGIIKAFEEVGSMDDYVPAAMQGPRTCYHVLSATESFPETLKSRPGQKRFRRHIEQLRRSQTLRESSIRRANRHPTNTLTLSPANPEGCADMSHSPHEMQRKSDAGASAPNASHSAGGYRGCAHAHCKRCDGEGCGWCEASGEPATTGGTST